MRLRTTAIRPSVLCGLVLCLCWVAASAQDDYPQTEQKLIITLWKVKREAPNEVTSVLEKNREMVNADLWLQLVDLAAQKYYENPSDAFAFYDIAKQVAVLINSNELLGRTLYDVARSYSGLGGYEKARSAYLESYKAFVAAGLNRDAVYILSDLGTISLIEEQYETAKDYSQRAIRLAESLKNSTVRAGAWPDSFGVANSLRTLAALALRDGDTEGAIAQLETALELLNQLKRLGNYDYYLTETNAALGRALTTAGDHVKALQFLIAAKTTAVGPQIPNILNSLGYLYLEQEDYSQAKAQFEQSLNIYQTQKNEREIARVLLNLGVVEQRQDHLEAALTLFNQSLSAANNSKLKDSQIAASEGLGVVLTAQGNFDQAITILRNALDKARELKDITRQTELLWRTAQTYYEKPDYNQALFFAQDALRSAQSTRSPKLTYLVTTTLGQIYAATGSTELAINTLNDAVDQVEAMRNHVAGRDESVQIFFENKVTPYYLLADLLHRQDKDSEALLYIDRSKSKVLLDAIKGRDNSFASVLSPSERLEAEGLNKRLSEMDRQIRSQELESSSVSIVLYQKLDSARLEYQLFQDRVYVAHPELKLRADPEPLTVKTLNALSQSRDEVFLEYAVSESHVGVFLIRRDRATNSTIKYLKLTIPRGDLERQVEEFHRLLAERRAGFEKLGRELYQALVQPVIGSLRDVKTICVVPDGVLWNLPFQALMTSDKRYLIETHSIYYAPSLGVLHLMTKPERQTTSGSLIAFGNPVTSAVEGELCPLPAAETEVKTITKGFRSQNVAVLVGPQATEKTFKSLAPNFKTIHLATHGILDNRDPMYSHLLLTKTEGDVENDGLLEAREIINMKLPANLAVLSACETANGRISPGEGVIGMSWAFFMAGTRSLLVSQWRVNSTSTSRLMTNFYKVQVTTRNETNASNADALRQATLQLRKDYRYRHPFYWAGFVMIGGKNRQ